MADGHEQKIQRRNGNGQETQKVQFHIKKCTSKHRCSLFTYQTGKAFKKSKLQCWRHGKCWLGFTEPHGLWSQGFHLWAPALGRCEQERHSSDCNSGQLGRTLNSTVRTGRLCYGCIQIMEYNIVINIVESVFLKSFQDGEMLNILLNILLNEIGLGTVNTACFMLSVWGGSKCTCAQKKTWKKIHSYVNHFNLRVVGCFLFPFFHSFLQCTHTTAAIRRKQNKQNKKSYVSSLTLWSDFLDKERCLGSGMKSFSTFLFPVSVEECC